MLLLNRNESQSRNCLSSHSNFIMPHVKGGSKDTYRLCYREKMVLYCRLWAGTAASTYVPLPDKGPILQNTQQLARFQCPLQSVPWSLVFVGMTKTTPSHSALHCNSYPYSKGTFIAREKDLGQMYLWALNEILVEIRCIKSLGEKKKLQTRRLSITG